MSDKSISSQPLRTAARQDIQSQIEKLKVQVADLQEQIARLEADSHDA